VDSTFCHGLRSARAGGTRSRCTCAYFIHFSELKQSCLDRVIHLLPSISTLVQLSVGVYHIKQVTLSWFMAQTSL
jgi:hypothetical protein